MAKYYAIVKQGYIQQDLDTGQLEIYETKKQANENCPNGYEIVKVKVKRATKSSNYPVPNDRMIKPEHWEDYETYEDADFERTYY